MPSCLIRQPAGLGDIIFCHKIAHAISKEGFEVYWPIVDSYYESVLKYMNTDFINFCRESDNFPMKELYNSKMPGPIQNRDTGDIYVPLQYSDLNFSKNESVMKVKYKIVNIEHNGWQEFFSIHRDKQREEHLFYEHFNLKDDTKYAIVNRWFGTTMDGYRKDIDVPDGLKVIEMESLGFDNIFDWCKVFENATEIHTVETAICYILEKIELNATVKKIYSRNCADRGFDYINGIFSKTDWEYIP